MPSFLLIIRLAEKGLSFFTVLASSVVEIFRLDGRHRDERNWNRETNAFERSKLGISRYCRM